MLKDQRLGGCPEDTISIGCSVPHGHVEALLTITLQRTRPR